MGIKSLLISKKFLISFAVNIIFLTLIGFLFSSSINSSIYSLKTWNNCESSYIAYDTREFDNNCYYYFGKNVSVNLSTGDSIRVNTDVYQFVNGKKYDIRVREELAVGFQHEMDHLEGILFTDYIDPKNPFKNQEKYRSI